MTSRQFDHLQEASLRQLQALVPHDCPLIVHRDAPVGGRGGFVVQVLDQEVRHSGRFEVVAAWIRGYRASWWETKP